ncbi:RNA polymerase sigma-70 factor (ECF subfamily) [Pseudonocardia sediminis]|uniref:RNA polymerase sigma-70 factor (ECF subfamily) n=1 Tax=Pseudonocardia sediminis TaxID=1397368 RepID=A0A4V2FQA6_PSEST|nr:RNA polymerase sigma-70 factor (ECF subfamily) [Pseudonocardia sediminis]
MQRDPTASPPSPASARAQADADLDLLLARLALAAVDGDRNALNELLARTGPVVVRYCRGRLGGRAVGITTPEDVAQDVLMAVCTSLHRFRDLEGPFLAFVYGIARNKVADVFRAAARDRSDPVEEIPERADDASGPEPSALALAEKDMLRELLDELPAQQREIVVLRLITGLSAEETARTVGSTAGAVRVAQHRAMQTMRRSLAARPRDDP